MVCNPDFTTIQCQTCRWRPTARPGPSPPPSSPSPWRWASRGARRHSSTARSNISVSEKYFIMTENIFENQKNIVNVQCRKIFFDKTLHQVTDTSCGGGVTTCWPRATSWSRRTRGSAWRDTPASTRSASGRSPSRTPGSTSARCAGSRVLLSARGGNSYFSQHEVIHPNVLHPTSLPNVMNMYYFRSRYWMIFCRCSTHWTC